MGSSVGKSLSISYFIGAALLAVFGFVLRADNPSDGAIQIALGAVMLGAGLYLRGGSSESRVAALGAAGLACAYGVFDLATGHGYVPGTIVAGFAFVRLMGAQSHFGQSHFGPAAAGPQAGQPIPYGAPAAYPQQAYPQQANAQAFQPTYPQPTPPPVPAPWSPPIGGSAPFSASAPLQPTYPQQTYPQPTYPQPTPPPAQPPSDPRFG